MSVLGFAGPAGEGPDDRNRAVDPGQSPDHGRRPLSGGTAGETQWVRNIRVAGGGELVLGRRAEAFTAEEVADGDKVDILRAYLKRWKAEVGIFFDRVSADSPEDDLRRIAPEHPVFRVRPAPAT